MYTHLPAVNPEARSMIQLDAAIRASPSGLTKALSLHAPHANAQVVADNVVASVKVVLAQAAELSHEEGAPRKGPCGCSITRDFRGKPVYSLAVAVGGIRGVGTPGAAVNVASATIRIVC